MKMNSYGICGTVASTLHWSLNNRHLPGRLPKKGADKDQKDVSSCFVFSTWVIRYRLFAYSRGPRGFAELREASRNRFHLYWCLSNAVVTSYDQKPSKILRTDLFQKIKGIFPRIEYVRPQLRTLRTSLHNMCIYIYKYIITYIYILNIQILTCTGLREGQNIKN